MSQGKKLTAADEKLLKALNEIKTETPGTADIIYHYCSLRVFSEIVTSKTIWLTDTRLMNDKTEGNWICSLFSEVAKEYHVDIQAKTCDQIEEIITQPRQCFTSCFSGKGDLLSQWRPYGDDGRGVAIGFDPKRFQIPIKKFVSTQQLKKNTNSFLAIVPVVYDKQTQVKIIKAFIDYSTGPDETVQAAHWLHSMGLSLKHPAFQEENENRIIFAPHPNLTDIDLSGINIQGPKVRLTENCLSQYYTLGFDLSAISVIVLGPKNNSDEDTIKHYIQDHGVTNVNVNKSEAPYR